jgi:hypothetical protein
MALQIFTPGQTLTATQLNNLQATSYNATQKVVTTVSYSLVSSDVGKTLVFTNAGAITVAVPDDLAITDGDTFTLILGGSGSLSLAPDVGVVINSEGDLQSLSNQWASMTLMQYDTNEFILGGLTAISTSELIDASVVASKIATGAVTSDKILDGTIVNADINASAAIALTKTSGTAANLRTALGGDHTGTGGAVFATSPTLTTPVLGVASGTSLGLSGSLTAGSLSTTGSTSLQHVLEKTTYSTSQVPTSLAIDVVDGCIYYYAGTNSTTATINLNIRGNAASSIDLNSLVTSGRAITVAVIWKNGAAARTHGTISIEGTTTGVSTFWFGGSSAPAEAAGFHYVYTYTIMRTNSITPATYTVFASQAKFGA